MTPFMAGLLRPRTLQLLTRRMIAHDVDPALAKLFLPCPPPPLIHSNWPRKGGIMVRAFRFALTDGLP